MNHPPATVRLAHQIIERVRESLPADATPKDLSARLASEYAEFFEAWSGAESDTVSESCGLVLTAVMVAADIASFMAKVTQIAPLVALQLNNPVLEESFWQTMKGCELDVLVTGNVADAHEAFLEWEEVAFREFQKRTERARPSATSDDDETQ
jgi:hypothetical protein